MSPEITAPTNNATAFLSRALPLIDRGLSVIPVQPGSKQTYIHNKSRDRAQIESWAKQFPNHNVGIYSDENFTLLETDDESRFRFVIREMTGKEIPATLTSSSGRPNRCTWIFRRSPECGAANFDVDGMFEFRNHNEYVVGPGSIHPDGFIYRFTNDVPVADFPAWIMPSLRELKAAEKGEATSPHVKTGAARILTDAYSMNLNPEDMFGLKLTIGQGSRHSTLMSMAAVLHDGEREPEDIYDLLIRLRDEYCEGEGKGEDELRRMADDIYRKSPCEMEPINLPCHHLSGNGRIIIFKTEELKQQYIADSEDEFSVSWEMFSSTELPEQKILLTLDDVPMIREGTLTEILAFRGLGKSALVANLIRVLTKGGEFCGIKADGGSSVLLVDGELPSKLLQARLTEFVGPSTNGLLRVRHLGKVKNALMPRLADRAVQEEFTQWVTGKYSPKVIVFDTRTALFKHDTNNAEQLLAVNEFLISLRELGKTVIITHHAGKNDTQRGRTDNDDPLDLIIQLRRRQGWEPGMGLEFSLAFEKVRYGDRLSGFDARWSREGGWQRINGVDSEITDALLAGESMNAIATRMSVSNRRVEKVKAQGQAKGLSFPVSAVGRKKAVQNAA